MDERMEEVLFDRILAFEASPEDWAEIEDVGSRDPEVWRRLAMAWKDQGDLVQAVGRAGQIAERIEFGPARATRSRWGPRSGWLAAAALLLAWVGSAIVEPPAHVAGGRSEPATTDGAPSAAGATPPASSGDSAAGARSEPHLVGELPAVLVGTRPLPDGMGIEVTYLRRLVERRTAKGLYERTTDEWGQPVVLPTTAPYARQEAL